VRGEKSIKRVIAGGDGLKKKRLSTASPATSPKKRNGQHKRKRHTKSRAGGKGFLQLRIAAKRIVERLLSGEVRGGGIDKENVGTKEKKRR